ncbi:MAG TPA: hypothetical protein RMG45_16910, partial [Polyangiaceae bacterium LLY-WYZ-15_(1-7)]|nr:hypothetical protein [Polyangiaceae bacterium LLY-WYZ-15_(1-7)]
MPPSASPSRGAAFPAPVCSAKLRPMCGRYTLTVDPEEIFDAFDWLERPEEAFFAAYAEDIEEKLKRMEQEVEVMRSKGATPRGL